MNKKNWIVPFVILALIALVIIYKDKFIIKEEEIIEADYCGQDSDCVLAVNPFFCCNCPIPMNKKVVELDEDYEVYERGADYSNYEKEDDCKTVFCELCNSNTNLTCYNNKCVFSTN